MLNSSTKSFYSKRYEEALVIKRYDLERIFESLKIDENNKLYIDLLVFVQ